MSYRRDSAVAGMTCGSVLVATLVALAPVAAHGQNKPNVTVVNPVSNPVNTRITNAVVPVEISNADAIPVVPQESEGSREIFSRSIRISMADAMVRCNSSDPLTVPAGKRMVIEYVSATAFAPPPAELVAVSLAVPPADQGRLVTVPAGKSALSSDGHSWSAAGQYVHAYSDGNLWACATASSPPPNDYVVAVSVTGYYVAKP
jgi:hypothetical protein